MGERWRIAQGSIVVTLAIAAAIWSQVEFPRIMAWIIGYALWVGISFIAFSGRFLFHWRDRYQTPIIINLINAGRGIWICSSAFVNWQAFANGGQFFWTLTTLWSITMAGGMIFMTVANDYFVHGILISAILFTAAIHQWPVCLSTMMFLLMAMKALREARQTRMNEVQLREKLTYQARIDSLTGLLNRVGLREQFDRLPPGPLGALFVDLDRFKAVNDRLGHAAGDELLGQVSQRLSQMFQTRPHILARLGGDEFYIVLSACPLRDLLAIADRILQILEQPFKLAAGQAYISASIGTASTEENRIDLEQLIRESDEAMYRAKQAGRRRVVYYDESLRQDALQRLDLEGHLRQAVAEAQIIAWGQPIIDYQQSRIANVELLARWQLNQQPISPELFIGVAANIGLTQEIAKIMVNQARDCLQQWQGLPSLQDTCVTINIESQDLVDGLIVDYLENLVFEAQIDPAKLILEITERGLIEAESKARFQIDRLHHLGVRVAIDDFGAGYSSLKSVMMLPVDLLKFDRSLVAAATQDQRMKNVLGAMVEMADSFKIVVIGEGIETVEDIDVMQHLNIQLLQGYYCAKPMPLKNFPHFARDYSPHPS